MVLRSRVLAALVAAALAGACAAEAEPSAVEQPDTTSTTSPPTTTSTTVEATTSTTAPIDVLSLRPPAPAADPAGLATQIADAERTLRDPAADDAALAEAALAQQVAYRALGLRPEWDAAVLGAVPEELHTAVTTHLAARREFRAMHRNLSPTLPAWQIVAPVPVEELRGHYAEAEAAFGIPWHYLAAIHLVETGMGRIRGLSVAGAQGPMQFMPATWQAYGAGGDVNDHRDAIMGAARYLAANNGPADMDNALFRYNNSNRYVRGVHHYAALMAEHPQAFEALYHWGIWYLTDQGDVYLPVGYEQPEPIPVAAYRPG
ncbi:MAG: transglycosylase SLT domain-containing protein [Acidimicrobiales bacterium]